MRGLGRAGAWTQEPELLFLDEPTSAVDPESRRAFWEKLCDLADAGTTLLVSTHYMDEAERCHRIAILDHGALVADGTPDDLTTALEGRTVLVDAAEPRQAQKVLVDVPGVLSVRSEEHTSELQSLMRISYAVFCLKKKQ